MKTRFITKRLAALLLILAFLIGSRARLLAWAATVETPLLASGVSGLSSNGNAVAATDTLIAVGAPQTNTGRGAVIVYSRNEFGWIQQAVLTASDAADYDNFGSSVALSGTTLAVGASGKASYQGVVYIFTQSGGVWTQRKKIVASDGVSGDAFGYSVSLNGSSLAVGAPYKTVAGRTYQGQAYVYTGSGATWTLQKKFTGLASAAIDYFGISVALNVDTLVVGAPTSWSAGYANVYTRSSSVWTLQATLQGANSAGDGFGYTVALKGDTVAVGAITEQVGSNPGQGAVYVFTRTGGWPRLARLTDPLGTAYNYFGSGLACNGAYIAIGAPYTNRRSNTYQGYLWLCRNIPGTGWSVEQLVEASDATSNAFFGNAVAFSGSTLAVGAPSFGSSPGKAYAYRVGAPVLRDTQASTFAISGNTMVLGAPDYAPGTNDQRGAVFIYTRTSTTAAWTLKKTLTLSTPVAYDRFGAAVALSGTTLLVGCPNRENGTSWDQGAAYVYTGSGTTWTLQKTLRPADGGTYRYFGSSVALSGSTAVVGAPTYGTSVNDQAVYAFVRSGTTWSQQAKMNNYGSVYSLALSGDTLAVGLPYSVYGFNSQQGRVEIWNRSGTTWSKYGTLLDAYNGRSFDYYGYSVSLSGDVLAVGAPGHSEYYNDRVGAVYVFYKSGIYWYNAGFYLSPEGAYTGNSYQDQFGTAVAVSGNTLAIGAPGRISVNFDPNVGAVYLFNRIVTSGSNQYQYLNQVKQALPYYGTRFGEVLDFDGGTLGMSAFGLPGGVYTLP